MNSQCRRILAHLQSGKKLTAKQAMENFGCMRLAARVHDLREVGHDIEMERITVRNRFDEKCIVGRYQLGEK